MDKGVKRINTRCASYPCHEGLQDCTFCFCPLYPCWDCSRGKYLFSKKQNKRIWSCRRCNWIHQKKVVDDIFQSIRGKETVLSEAEYFKNQEYMGVVILAHGSRVNTTKDTVGGVVDSLKKNLKLKHILPAYLQFCRPALSEATRELAGKGCRKIIIVPYFLFNGNHVIRDIPLLIQKEKEKYPGIELVYTRALAEDEKKISDIITPKIEEAI